MNDITNIINKVIFSRLLPSGRKYDLECTTGIKLLIAEAEAAGISWKIVPDTDICRFWLGDHVEYSRFGIVSKNRVPGPSICDNKYLTRQVLVEGGVSVVPGYVLMTKDSIEDRRDVFSALQKPLVVKPANGTHGNGVKVGITSFEELNTWTDYLFTHDEKDTDTRRGMVLVEETAPGEEYRIISTKKEVVAVMKREPASVIGDGKHSIKDLIDSKNTDPARNISPDLYPHIQPDSEMEKILQESNYGFESIVPAGKRVFLRKVSNIMAGGDAIDCTDIIHPSVINIAIRLTNLIPGMELVGIDFMTTDITKDQQFEKYHIIEVNRSPEYSMHDMPMIGIKRGVARKILELMFPEISGEAEIGL